MANGWNESREDVQARLDREKQAADERRANAERLVDERIAARDQGVSEFYEMVGKVKPTPTARECDLIMMGVQLDELEPSGAEPAEEFQARVMEGRLSHNNPYETRALGGPEGEQRRGRGRPRKQPEGTEVSG